MFELLKQFGNDPETIAIVALIAADFVFGVAAAVFNKTQSINFAYLGDFLRTDVLGKLVPVAGLWFLFHATGDIQLGDLEVIETGASTFAIVALSASVLKSLKDLGLPVPALVAPADPVTPA